MRTRPLIVGGVATGAALSLCLVVAAQASGRTGHDLPFHAVFLRTQALDLGAAGVGMGDQLVYTDRFVDPAAKNKVLGTGFGDCVRMSGNSDTVGVFHCTETVRLAGGDVLIGGLYDLAAASDAWTITGGTARYRGASGEVSFRPLDATNFEGVFHFDH